VGDGPLSGGARRASGGRERLRLSVANTRRRVRGPGGLRTSTAYARRIVVRRDWRMGMNFPWPAEQYAESGSNHDWDSRATNGPTSEGAGVKHETGCLITRVAGDGAGWPTPCGVFAEWRRSPTSSLLAVGRGSRPTISGWMGRGP
jgi:hypothetical protein